MPKADTPHPKMIPRPGIELANLTDIGSEREQNEDYYCYFEPVSDADFRRHGRLAVVADGMGVHEGGQLASSIAVETVRAGRFDNITVQILRINE